MSRRCGCWSYQRAEGCPGAHDHVGGHGSYGQCATIMTPSWDAPRCLPCLQYASDQGHGSGCAPLIALQLLDGTRVYEAARMVSRGLVVVQLDARTRRARPPYKYAIAHEATGSFVAFATDLRVAKRACRRLAHARVPGTQDYMDWTGLPDTEKLTVYYLECDRLLSLYYTGKEAVIALSLYDTTSEEAVIAK